MASRTRIGNPSPTGIGHSGRSTGAASGVAQGAAAGAMVGGPVGAAVGAVVGGIVGAIGGGQSDQAERYRKIAYKYQTMGKERQQAIAIRDQLREFRMKRAIAMASIGMEEGGTRSSAPQGATDSLNSQYAFNYAYTEGQIYLERQYAKFMRKAGRKQSQSNSTFAYLDAASSLANTYGKWQAGKPPSSPPTTTPTPGQTPPYFPQQPSGPFSGPR